MRAIDPIFVAPRLAPRKWGRMDLGEWFGHAKAPDDTVAEAWVLDPANATDAGPLGRRLAQNPTGMLGDLGRAPPKLRLVFPGERATLKPTSPVSFWTVLEPGVPSLDDSEQVRHRPGERIRALEGAAVDLAAGSVALEVSSSFLPTNSAERCPQIIRLPPVSARPRATLFRDASLSVETWSLPEWSRVVPDGETCHVLMALSKGVDVHGRALAPGEAIFLPAWGYPLDITTSIHGARLLVAYPDRVPTSIWRHAPGPEPSPAQLPKPEPAKPPVFAVARPVQPAKAA